VSIGAALFFIMILSMAAACAGAQAGQDAQAAAADRNARVHVDRWLLLGPFGSPLPAFGAEGKKGSNVSALLSYEELPIDKMKPAEGAAQALFPGAPAVWRGVPADTNGVLLPAAGGEPRIAYLATYFEIPRWAKVSVSARSSAPFSITIDGADVVKRDAAGGFKDKKSGEAKLEPGTHLLIAKTVRMSADTTEWRFDVSFAPAGKGGAIPTLSASPEKKLSLGDILYIQNITRAAISPDGNLAAITTGTYSKANEKYQSWIEIRAVKDGSLVRTLKDIDRMSDLQWAPTGRRLSYVASGEKDSGSLRILDLDNGECTTILENVKNLEGYLWSRDASFIVYSVSEKTEPDKRGVRHLTTIEDRWKTGGGDRSYLYLTTVPGGMTRRLTAGKHNTGIYDAHPDGKHILISRSYEELSQRPYGTTELLLMNIETQKVDSLWKGPWLGGASFSPDGRKILVEAGPSSFGPKGVRVKEGMIPNDYDGQLYLFDPATREAEPLTRDFDPAVQSSFWSKVDGNIYLTAEEGSYTRLFRYNVKKKAFQRIETGFEVIGSGGIATDKLAAVYVGSNATQPPRLFSIDLAKGKSRMIFDPNAGDFASIKQGAVEEWSFTASSGKKIDGYFYLPPGFDPQKKYPCIVYYYGGTSPTNRTYGGRYPKNLWAAQGYVVYVLQPSGATGYGQEFSAYHVNDWGLVVAGEIIEGTKQFVAAHPFVDGARLGCIGASYGGFMTQLLVTKTDIFAAAVSHAGISSIASYWGEGYWGYSYNAVAAAGSFPWNRRDIYVEQSPLFSADKITTPLLLLHGTDDTNVPPGESEQMFTALKLLGKNVEYIQVEGQNHAVMDYKKRDIWSKTILAWFDRYLKNEPEWWNDLYPKSAPEEKEGAAEEESAAGAKAAGEAPAAPAQAPAPAVEPAKIGVKVVTKQDGSKVLLGEITKEDIVSNLGPWDASYFEYQPDEILLGDIAGRMNGVSFIVVLGTWCSDSHEQVPRFWKVLDAIGFPMEKVKMFGVERGTPKPDPALAQELIDWSKNLRAWYGTDRVETIIVYRNGAELGRIVEAPAKSIEADLLEILKR